MNVKKIFINILIPLLIIGVGLAGYALLVALKPKAITIPPRERVVMVHTDTLQSTSAPIALQATGNIQAARRIELKPEVGGRIYKTAEAFKPGGLFQAGDPMLWIDPVDFENALAQARSTLSQAEYAYEQELGRQAVALHEWDMIEENTTISELEKNLILRKPQLAQAEAQLEAARKAVDTAELNIERARVTVPFNAQILSRSVELGSQVSSQTTLAELVGTDEYWLTATLPVDYLQWLNIPGNPAEIRIRDQSEEFVQGEVFSVLPALEENGRLARIVLRIPDPLASPVPLHINAYAYADMMGKTIENLYIIPADALHKGGEVWLMNSEDRLEIRPVHVLWRTRDQVYIDAGLADGERLITTDIPALMPNMKLTLTQDKNAE